MTQSNGTARGSKGKSGHRDKRDTNSKAARELKQENKELRKKVARLQKAVVQSDENSLELQEVLAENVDINVHESVQRCPLCNSSDFASFTTPGGKVLSGCRKCSKKAK